MRPKVNAWVQPWGSPAPSLQGPDAHLWALARDAVRHRGESPCRGDTERRLDDGKEAAQSPAGKGPASAKTSKHDCAGEQDTERGGRGRVVAVEVGGATQAEAFKPRQS